MKKQKGSSLIIIILIAVGIVAFLLLSDPEETNTTGKSTTNYDYLLKNKPTSTQIASAKTITYRSLYKGANTLNGKFYKITGEIVQEVSEHIYHVNMTKNGTGSYSYYSDRIQISVIGTTSEILMEGDIITFTGESLGNYTYTTVLGNNSTIPYLRVYAENLKVTGHTN